MKTFLIAVISLLYTIQCTAQSCAPGFNLFGSQQSVDDFFMDNPDCTHIEGNINIIGSDITDLSGFSNIETIDGFLIIRGSGITNLSALSQLREVGGDFILTRCQNLLSLQDLQSLVSVGGKLSIDECYSLQDLGNLPQQTTVNGFVLNDNRQIKELSGFDTSDSLSTLIITRNDSLQVFTAFSNVEYIDEITVSGEELTVVQPFEYLTELGTLDFSLQDKQTDGNIGFNALKKAKFIQLRRVKLDFDGFHQLDTITGSLWIEASQLTAFNGFNQLKYVGADFKIYEINENANGNLIGFEMLEEVGVGFFITGNEVDEFFLMPNLKYLGRNSFMNFQFIISGNSFENLDFCSSIVATDSISFLGVTSNPFLNNISGLDNIVADSITELRIRFNDNLSVCHTKLVCDYLALDPPRATEIFDNKEGCNSIEEILEQCPDKPDEDPSLCPITSRPGMQIDRVNEDTYNIMYHYGVKRMYLRDIRYTELVDLIAYHKVEKDILFDFDTFTLERYCERADEISRGEIYQPSMPTDPLMEYKIEVTLSEIDFFQNFVLTIKEEESVKL